MTTDFLVTFRDKTYARTTKPASELEDDRTIAKFEIERMYWESRHIEWGIVVEDDLPDILIRNIEWVHKEYHNDDVQHFGPFAVNQLKQILAERLDKGEPISKACLACDDRLGLEAGTALAMFRHFIARKVWSVNMYERIIPSLPAIDFKFNLSNTRLEAAGG